MIFIRSSADLARTLEGPLEPDLRRLLELRRDQLIANSDDDLGQHAHFIVVRPSDTIAAVEAALAYPLTEEAPFEWIERHPFGWIEAPIITDDEGFAITILVRDCITTDPALLAALRAHV